MAFDRLHTIGGNSEFPTHFLADCCQRSTLSYFCLRQFTPGIDWASWPPGPSTINEVRRMRSWSLSGIVGHAGKPRCENSTAVSFVTDDIPGIAKLPLLNQPFQGMIAHGYLPSL